jgi:hypothetical protein
LRCLWHISEPSGEDIHARFATAALERAAAMSTPMLSMALERKGARGRHGMYDDS